MNVLLLDRDGVLVSRRVYDYLPEHMVPLPGVVAGLQRFRDAGYRFFVLSNQSGVGRGLQTMESVIACNDKLTRTLKEEDVHIQQCLFCPHIEEDRCNCRKPKTGMWEELVRHHALQPSDCLMVGDRPADIMLGNNIGCPTVLVGTTDEECPEPTYRAKDLDDLADQLLA